VNEVIVSTASAIGLALFGWAWSVEKRITELFSMKETIEKVDSRVEKIYDHLLEKK
jgi:hypothetical protein